MVSQESGSDLNVVCMPFSVCHDEGDQGVKLKMLNGEGNRSTPCIPPKMLPGFDFTLWKENTNVHTAYISRELVLPLMPLPVPILGYCLTQPPSKKHGQWLSKNKKGTRPVLILATWRHTTESVECRGCRPGRDLEDNHNKQ